VPCLEKVADKATRAFSGKAIGCRNQFFENEFTGM